LPLERSSDKGNLTTLVSMKSSAFPYFGNNPRSEAPFLNIAKGERRGHRSSSGKVYWQDETYNDSRVLVHVPEHFDARKPGVIVVVGYSGGFLPTAWSLEVGGITSRIRGVFLLDAVYGELDKFATWIENNRSGFFVSSYTRYTKRRDQELMAMLREKGISYREDMDGPLRPGTAVFVQTPEGVTH